MTEKKKKETATELFGKLAENFGQNALDAISEAISTTLKEASEKLTKDKISELFKELIDEAKKK